MRMEAQIEEYRKLMRRKKCSYLLAFAIGCLCIGTIDAENQNRASNPVELWSHLSSASELVDVRGMSAQFDDSNDRRVLKLNVPRLNLALGEAVRDPRRGIA
jgi:hypothetical protein